MKTYFLFCLGFVFCTAATAQGMRLTLGGKTKVFKVGTYIDILMPAKEIEPCEKCSHNFVAGKIISYRNSILTLELRRKGEMIVQGGKVKGHQIMTYYPEVETQTLSLPKSVILSATPSGKKKYKERSTGETIGMVIGLLGAAHLVSAPLAGENAGLLAAFAASELVVGIILGGSTGYRTYITSLQCPGIAGKEDKIWILD